MQMRNVYSVTVLSLGIALVTDVAANTFMVFTSDIKTMGSIQRAALQGHEAAFRMTIYSQDPTPTRSPHAPAGHFQRSPDGTGSSPFS